MFLICRTIGRHFSFRQVKSCIGQRKKKQTFTTQGSYVVSPNIYWFEAIYGKSLHKKINQRSNHYYLENENCHQSNHIAKFIHKEKKKERYVLHNISMTRQKFLGHFTEDTSSQHTEYRGIYVFLILFLLRGI